MTTIKLIAHTLNGIRIRDSIDDSALKKRISIIIYTLFEIAGQTPVEHDVNVIIRETVKDLRKKYSAITVEELDYALNAGVRGEYGDYFGINVVSINRWLRAYYNSEERREAQRSRNFPDLLCDKCTSPTAEEILSIKIEAYNNALSLSAAGQYVKDRGNCVYDFLAEKGEIHFTPAEKHHFMEKAKEELTIEARRRIRDARTPRPVGDIIAAITDKEVIMRAKRIALNIHLKRIQMDKF
jgi:hypothetical protein